MTNLSIVGAAVAKDLLDKLAASTHQVWFHGNGRHKFTARLRRTTGGQLFLGLDGAPLPVTHTTRRAVSRTQYVCSKDEQRGLNRAITAFWRDLQAFATDPAVQAREALCLLTETREVPDAWMDRETMPHPAILKFYDDLTVEECAALTPLVEALPLKAPVVA